MNYTFLPQSLENFVHDPKYADDDIIWLVVDIHDWENDIVVGPTFSDFSVVQQYVNSNIDKNFIITEV